MSRNLLFVTFVCLVCQVRSDDEKLFKPKKKHTQKYLRNHVFLPNEKQSCNDISDHRKVDRTVHFCTLPVPELDSWTTLSFWGWRHLKPKNTTVSVQLYSVSDTNETFQFEIPIKREDREDSSHYAKWYHHDFIFDGTKIILLCFRREKK
mmetsp:Transcript_35772/g.46099  ORF Transcript_35772/g.46099 Transcript_35772/m.46099 type:complete len:150 (-) Transcript_35772:909-1358(-)